MARSGKNGSVRTLDTAGPSRNVDIYRHYATGLYRQAFLTLGDPALAEQIVRDVIVGECALGPVPGGGEGDTPRRLAESVFWRCQQLAADPAWRHRLPASRPPGDVADDVDPGGILSAKERGALALVLIGGLGYVRASSVLGIRPRDMAALLRTALLRLEPHRPPQSRDGGRARDLPPGSHEPGAATVAGAPPAAE